MATTQYLLTLVSFFVFGWLVLKQPKWIARHQMAENERDLHDFRKVFGIQTHNHCYGLYYGILEWGKIVQGIVDKVLAAKACELHDACENQANRLAHRSKINKEMADLAKPNDNDMAHLKESEKNLAEANRIVRIRKTDFWTAHALAESCGGKVRPKHTDYLKEKPTPASA